MAEASTMSGQGEAEVRLAGSLASLATGGSAARVESGQTIGQVAVAMGLPAHQRYIATVNGQVCAADYVLSPGDRATLFPPISGGAR